LANHFSLEPIDIGPGCRPFIGGMFSLPKKSESVQKTDSLFPASSGFSPKLL
jgi:hypothetical protein